MIVVIDVETTGLDKEKDAVIEVAAINQSGNYYSALVNPSRNIPPEVTAINYITDEMEKGGLSLKSALEELYASLFPPALTSDLRWCVFVAHNAEFDRGFLPELKGEWLCTMRCAMHLYPDAPSYKNDALRFYLRVEPKFPVLRPGELSSHTALYDVCVTKALLDRMLEEHTLEELLDLQHKPVLQKRVRFGRHRGELWSEVPRSYLDWAFRSIIDDKDVMFTVEHWRDMR